MYRNVLTQKAFLFYLLAGGISRLGDVVSGLAFLFLAHDLTGSAVHTTGVVIAETVPYLLFGLVGGVVTDWVKKKPLLVLLDLVRAPVIFSLFFMYNASLLGYWHLIGAGFLIQSLGCFFNPAHRALLPLITAAEDRPAANSLVDTVTRGVQVASPLVTLPLLHGGGVISFYLFDACTYLISAGLIACMPLREAVPEGKKRFSAILPAIRDFVRWVAGERRLRLLFVISFLTVFLNTWVWDVGLMLRVKAITPNGEAWYSTMMGGFGGIVIVANLLIPLLWKRLSLATYLYGALVWGVGILTLGIARHPSAIFLGIVLVGAGMPLSGLSRVYLLQALVPEEMLGRGFSLSAMLLYLANVASLAVYGALAAYVPLPLLSIGSGGLMILCACGYLYRLRKAPGETAYTRLNS
jgi:DHA3 family macrolide efflux protein-like MFS transporter